MTDKEEPGKDKAMQVETIQYEPIGNGRYEQRIVVRESMRCVHGGYDDESGQWVDTTKYYIDDELVHTLISPDVR